MPSLRSIATQVKVQCCHRPERQTQRRASSRPHMPTFRQDGVATGPAYRNRLRDEDDIEAWRLSCRIESNDFFSSNSYDNPKTTWKYVRLYNTPPPIAMEIARKLVEKGGPFLDRNPRDLFYCIQAITMLERILAWVLIKDEIYEQIYEHLLFNATRRKNPCPFS